MNKNIRSASRTGNVVTVAGGIATLVFCNEKGAAHYMKEREKARKNPGHRIVTKTFEAAPEK